MNDPRQLQSRSLEECAVLVLCPHPASALHHKHGHVQNLTYAWFVTLRHDGLDYQHLAVLRHCITTVPQCSRCDLIAPVHKDAFEDVNIAAGGQGFEHVTADNLAVLSDALGERDLADHLRKVEEHARDVRVGFQDRGEGSALAASDIHHLPMC